MKQTVYIDVLVGVNLLINYFLLLAVAKFLSIQSRRLRLLLASMLGALYSLTILLPDVNLILSFILKLAMAATIVFVAYPWRDLMQFFRQIVAFYIMSFGFAGIMLAIWYFISPQGLIIKNSVIYFNISPLLLIVLTVICYLIIRVIYRLTGRQAPEELNCRIKIDYSGKTVTCMAKVDTGNMLTEPFSNYPVVVVFEKCIADMVPQEDSGKIRFVPYEAVSGGGLLPAYKPDLLTVICGKKQIEIHNVYIAVTKAKLGEFSALLNPDLLQKTSA